MISVKGLIFKIYSGKIEQLFELLSTPKQNPLLGEKIDTDFFHQGRYLVREDNSFSEAKLEENFDEFRGIDKVQGPISEHVLKPNKGYYIHYLSNILAKRHARVKIISCAGF